MNRECDTTKMYQEWLRQSAAIQPRQSVISVISRSVCGQFIKSDSRFEKTNVVFEKSAII